MANNYIVVLLLYLDSKIKYNVQVRHMLLFVNHKQLYL